MAGGHRCKGVFGLKVTGESHAARDGSAASIPAWHVPVVVAGGSKVSDLDALEKLSEAMQAGAVGCSVGRNIFQHRQPARIVQALHGIVHLDWEVDQALEILKD